MDFNNLWSDIDLKSQKQNSRCLAINTILVGKYLVGPVQNSKEHKFDIVKYRNL